MAAHRRLIHTLTLAVVIAALAPPSGAEQPPSALAGLPDTPAGQRAAGYLAAFNGGDDRVVERYFAENLAAEALTRRPLAERVATTRRMREELRSLTLRRVLEERPNEIALVLAAGSGDFLKATFTLAPEPPHSVLTIRLDRVDEDEGSNGAIAPMTEAEALAAIRTMIAERAAADQFAGTVLVAKGGKVLLNRAWGLASREFAVPNRPDTKYNLGSINKLFTKVAIGQLVEAGTLSFDTRLGEVLPDYPNRDAREKVTIRHLLDMESGIGDFFGPRFEATPKDRLRTIADYLALFADQPLAFEPGTRRQYSNGGFVVLGAVIEKLTGMSYYDYVREHVFAPAGMKDTESFEADVPVADLATGYTRLRDGQSRGVGQLRSNVYSRPARGSSAGGGYSTTGDLLRFLDALLADRLLSPAYTDWFLTGAVTPEGQPRAARERGSFGFAGGAPGINAAIEADFAASTIVIVLGNLDPPAAQTVARRIRATLAAVKR